MSKNLTREQITAIATEAAVAAVLAVLGDDTAPAKVTQPKAAPKPQPKADVRYRTAKQLEAGHAETARIWDEAKAKAGVKRCSQLTPAQKKAAQAKVDAAWKALKGTRKTKVA